MRKELDYFKLRERTFDRETINYIGLIHEYKGKQELYLEQKPEELDRLIELSKIQSTESSNEIEGIVTTNQRFVQLMKDKTTPKNRSEKEIKGYRHVLDIIHTNFDYIPITPNMILQLHRELYQFSEERFGGKFKDSPNEIDAIAKDGTKTVLFRPLEPFETPEAMEKLCKEYDKAIHQYRIDPLIVIPVFIHDFLCIHPFNDGNGRMSRLLTTLLLYQNGYEVGKYISLEKKIQITKSDYYDALQASSRGWMEGKNDDTPFIQYLLGTVLAAYRDFQDRVNIVGKKMSAREMVEKAVHSKIGKFTKADILELCPEISKGSVEQTLKKLCDEGKIKKEGVGKATFYYTVG